MIYVVFMYILGLSFFFFLLFSPPVFFKITFLLEPSENLDDNRVDSDSMVCWIWLTQCLRAVFA